MNCDCLIAPGVLELVTAIGDVNKLHAQLSRGVCEAAGLVAKLRCEKKELGSPIRLLCQGRQRLSTQTNDSVCGNVSFALANGANWSRVGSAQQYQGSFK